MLNTLKAIAKETDAELTTRIAAIESEEVQHLMKRAAMLHASQRAAMAAAAAGAAAGCYPARRGCATTIRRWLLVKNGQQDTSVMRSSRVGRMKVA